ncbi:hypothetical protein B9Z55_012083 [Caenorhabditis nigoni]|nr:hypothetical protein B9Z55_012083 [Caenorhabditis nigoni]
MPTKLFLASLLIFGSLIPAHVCEEDPDAIEEANNKKAEYFNKIRRQLAKELQVANMHEVSYDEDLENEFTASCERLNEYRAENIRFHQAEHDSTGKTYNMELEKISGYSVMNCLHPLQTEVACKITKCSPEDAGACVCGPETSFSSSDWIKGEAGTECDGGDDDGLCTGGSSGIFNFGIILNLILFYLVAYLF